MNKRQLKKNKKKTEERLKFLFGNSSISIGRQCGKTNMITDMVNIASDKGYRRFKVLRKYIEKWRKIYG